MFRLSLHSITGVKFTFAVKLTDKIVFLNYLSFKNSLLINAQNLSQKKNTTIAPFLIVGNFCVNCSLLRMKNGLFVSTVQVGKLLTLIDL